MCEVEIDFVRTEAVSDFFIFRSSPKTALVPPPPSSGGTGFSEEARQTIEAEIQSKRLKKSPEERIASVRERLQKLKRPESRELAQKILNGESFAQPGERDHAMMRVTGMICNLEPALSEDEVLSILRASLDSMMRDAVQLGVTLPEDAWALEKIARNLENARQRAARERDKFTAVQRILLRENYGTVDDGETEELTFYSEEKLAEYAEQQSCSVDVFKQRWVIHRGSSFYIYSHGKYLPPITKDELATSMRRDLAPAPIEWFTFAKDGTIRKKTVDELLEEHSTVARHLVSDLTRTSSFYDYRTQTFYEALPRRNIKPRYDAHIEEWLRRLGGEHKEKLLDWIATVTDLSSQTCALYLSGPPSSGKTLLANGLARIWTDGSPTSLARILENFNGDLLNCPLVFADEYVPRQRDRSTTAEIRELIGAPSRTLTRKHLANSQLIGAIRLIIAGNNSRLLATDEDLSNDDMEAVGKRILHIRVTSSAVEYLQGLGGRSGGDVNKWITEDRLAAFALWLKDNRKVVPGNRFLVEGHRSDFHNSLPTQGKINSLIMEWLVKFLNAPDQKRYAIEQQGQVLVGNGKYLVNVEAVTTTWAQFITSDNPPATGRVGRGLRNMSKEVDRIHNKRFHVVNLDLVYRWANENLVGDVELMKKLITRPLGDKEMAPIKRSLLHIV